ncbi:MAG: ribonuclease toxin HepT-like protein [Deferrisomatales bacterium]
MRHNVELLKADVREELRKLRRLAGEFQDATARVPLSTPAAPSYDRAAIGYLLHNFYNGCENVFRAVARFFENDLGADAWHRDLLRRMHLEIPGYRPRVIDEALLVALDEFRGFRHRFRHCYSFELDWERERLLAAKLPATEAAFRDQVDTFLGRLEELG